MHNLFGDTHAVHIELDADGEVVLETVIQGDTVTDVLRYVCFDQQDLLARVKQITEEAVLQGRFSRSQAKRFLEHYAQGLAGYTYLESDSSCQPHPEP